MQPEEYLYSGVLDGLAETLQVEKEKTLAYWWVTHGNDHAAHDIKGGILSTIAYYLSKAGNRSNSYSLTNLCKMQIGDIIISCADNEVGALGIVICRCQKTHVELHPALNSDDVPRPSLIVGVKWTVLDPRIDVKLIKPELRKLQGEKGPLDRDDHFKVKGFAYSIPPPFAERIVQLRDDIGPAIAEAVEWSRALDTTRKTLREKIGQDGGIDPLIPEAENEEAHDLEIIGSEGQMVYREHRSYERDRKLRKDVLSLKGTNCQHCGFNFETEFGSLFSGYAEIHHLTPISQGTRSSTPDDFAVLCSNCHSAVHYKTKAPRPISDLKRLAELSRTL